MIKFEDINCDYDGRGRFRFSWDRKQKDPSVTRVILFEVTEKDPDLYNLSDANLQRAKISDGSVTFQSAAEREPEHRFIILAAGDNPASDSSDKPEAIAKWCREQGIDNLIVKGISIEGTLYYQVNQADEYAASNLSLGTRLTPQTGLTLLELTLYPQEGLEIPQGYIYYSYTFNDRPFDFMIPQIIDQETTLRIYVPDGFENFVVKQERSKIEVLYQYPDEDQPAGCFLGRLWKKLRRKKQSSTGDKKISKNRM